MRFAIRLLLFCFSGLDFLVSFFNASDGGSYSFVANPTHCIILCVCLNSVYCFKLLEPSFCLNMLDFKIQSLVFFLVVSQFRPVFPAYLQCYDYAVISSSGITYPACASMNLATMDNTTIVTTDTIPGSYSLCSTSCSCWQCIVYCSEVTTCTTEPTTETINIRNYQCKVGFSFNSTVYASLHTYPTSCSCAAGRFSSLVNGNATCITCAAGSYTDMADLSSCVSCPSGRYSTTIGATASSSCVACANGTYAPTSGTTSCTLCSAGKYASSTASFDCMPCIQGTYSNTHGATSSDTCRPCAGGTYSDSMNATSCSLCPVGAYSETAATSCSQCGPGTFSSSPMSSNCTACLDGYFSNANGSASCTACSAGSYASSSKSSCIKCPAGTYSVVAAASSPDVCMACPVGSNSLTEGSTSCIRCSPGTYASSTTSSPCIQCAVGTYSSSFASTSCTECAKGTYQAEYGQSTCTLCPSGYYCPSVSTANVLPCDRGTVSQCPANISSCATPLCEACPVNTYAGQTGAAACQPCPPNLYAYTVGSTTCTSNGLSVSAAATDASSSMSSGSMVGLIIGPIVAGVIGLLFWKIQRSKEWALYREEHPLAHVLYEQMKLKYANFKSAEGIQYMTMIYALEKQMKACGFKYGNVDEFNALTPKQRQEVAIHIETSFRSYQQGPKAVDTGCWTKLVSSYNKSLNLDMLLQDSSLIQAICKQTISLVGVVSIRSSIELNETELRVVVNPLEDATASE
jgi:hypothetical protein